MGLRKSSWTGEEDTLLRQYIDKYGEGKWHQVLLRAGLNRCRKSCRLRLNYLKPSIKRGKLSSDKVDLLIRLHRLLGNSITCGKDEENYESVYDLMDGQNTWLESLLEESQEADAPGPEATTTETGATLAFDIEQLWNMFDEETVELD